MGRKRKNIVGKANMKAAHPTSKTVTARADLSGDSYKDAPPKTHKGPGKWYAVDDVTNAKRKG